MFFNWTAHKLTSMWSHFSSLLDFLDWSFVLHHSLVAASVPRGRQWDLHTLQNIITSSEMQWWAIAHCRAVLVLHPSPAPVPKCPSVYKKQTGNKKIKETKRKKERKRNPPTPQLGLPARHWLQVYFCVCVCVRACMRVCVRISVCAVMAARVSENMWGLLCVCVWRLHGGEGDS